MKSRKLLIFSFILTSLTTFTTTTSSASCLSKWKGVEHVSGGMDIPWSIAMASLVPVLLPLVLPFVPKTIADRRDFKRILMYPYLDSPEQLLLKDNCQNLYHGEFEVVKKESEAAMTRLMSMVEKKATKLHLTTIPSRASIIAAIKQANEQEQYCYDGLKDLTNRIVTNAIFNKTGVQPETVKIGNNDNKRSLATLFKDKPYVVVPDHDSKDRATIKAEEKLYEMIVKEVATKKLTIPEIPSRKCVSEAIKVAMEKKVGPWSQANFDLTSKHNLKLLRGWIMSDKLFELTGVTRVSAYESKE
ncbi:MAG: hypothetical protein HQK50_08630 [Oligoflexia bacterium]|nr:hypothetical protein [Oligoflexia bacterium]MBF0365624.1 hypothetical protein [Oligoflexia bacterium]